MNQCNHEPKLSKLNNLITIILLLLILNGYINWKQRTRANHLESRLTQIETSLDYQELDESDRMPKENAP